MKKRINKEIIIVAIISILFLMMSIVYADYLYNSNQVSFNNNNTTLSSTDVQSAIDELYNKCSNIPSVGTCPEGYECTPLTRVTYNANGGTFSGNETNIAYYNIVADNGVIQKISKTSNVDDNGTKTGNMPQASNGITHTVTIEGAESLEVEITYQTHSSYSYVDVRNAAGNTVSSKLYGTTKTTKTYTITGDTVKFYFYNSKSQSSSYSNYYGYYAKIKGKKNDKYIKDITITKEEGEYKEPTNQNTQLEFVGWVENLDGSSEIYKTEWDVLNSLNVENRKIELYATWKDPTLICKSATTLHTETCTNTDNNGYCQLSGYNLNSTITYGSLGTQGELTSGDAFDCDVNGDGIYSSQRERFYYISDYFDTDSQTFDNTYATMVFFSNTYGGVNSTDGVIWDTGSYTYSGPGQARNQLPTTSQWRDDLLKTRTRNILVGTSPETSSSIQKSDFSYAGIAARLLTYQEVYNGCTNTLSITATRGLINKCEYLMENTQFADSSGAFRIWLETAYDYTHAWDIDPGDLCVRSDSVSSTLIGVRPVIEIPKTLIDY